MDRPTPLGPILNQVHPRGKLGHSPYEMLYGHQPPLMQPNSGNIKGLGYMQLRGNIQALGKIIQAP